MISSRQLMCLGIVSTLLCTNRVLGDAATLTNLNDYPSVQKTFARRMFLAALELGRWKKANQHAHVIVGRVQLEGNDDPETVVSQMLIADEGFFVDVISDLNRPVEFRRHRYKPVDFIVPKEAIPVVEGVIDVGVVQMPRASATQRGTITGKLKLDGGGNPSGTKVVLNIRSNPRPNTPSRGTEGIGRKHRSIPGTVKRDGTITFESLSEGEYYAKFTRKGFVSVLRSMSVSAGETTDMGHVNLERPRKIKLDYVVARDPQTKFDAAARKTASFAAGHRWKSRPDTYAWDLEFMQTDGALRFSSRHGPCYMTDLGEGKLDDFLDVPFKVNRVSPNDIPCVSGHVYLLNHRHWKHHVLLHVQVESVKPVDAEQPNEKLR